VGYLSKPRAPPPRSVTCTVQGTQPSVTVICADGTSGAACRPAAGSTFTAQCLFGNTQAALVMCPLNGPYTVNVASVTCPAPGMQHKCFLIISAAA
jgi:hypothetical protein